MAVYITGDTHGTHDVNKLLRFKEMAGADDFLIVLGGFGVCWDGGNSDAHTRRFWERFKCHILFVDGNHENHILLNDYPWAEWNGGKVHVITDRIYHLMRGQVFEIDGSTFFTMGGAASHDCGEALDVFIKDNLEEYYTLDWKSAFKKRRRNPHEDLYRVPGKSWWAEEIPSPEEISEAKANLERAGYVVDFVLTHCPPKDVRNWFVSPDDGETPWEAPLMDLFTWIQDNVSFGGWLFGHMHHDINIGEAYTGFYNSIKRVC
jgi:hypothetical protein